ncbi:hypothetical protein ACOSP7_005211 [Xanthoceras sorbifolium]
MGMLRMEVVMGLLVMLVSLKAGLLGVRRLLVRYKWTLFKLGSVRLMRVEEQRKSARGIGGLWTSSAGKVTFNIFRKYGGSRFEVLVDDDCEDADLVVNNVKAKSICETGMK